MKKLVLALGRNINKEETRGMGIDCLRFGVASKKGSFSASSIIAHCRVIFKCWNMRPGRHLAIIGFRAPIHWPGQLWPLFSVSFYFSAYLSRHLHSHSGTSAFVFIQGGQISKSNIQNNFARVTLPLPWWWRCWCIYESVVLPGRIIQRNRAVQIFVSIR